MDRGRESRRGGGGSGAVSGHHASSRRRPRSGFKDSTVVCEEEEGLNESPDSARLRERSSSNNNINSKKERSGLSSSRNKRKRPGLHHERFHGSSRDRDRDQDGGDDSSEESAGEEDEEEDDEPPRPPPPNPRKATKFKSQCKVSDDMIGVGLISVPRKARSAAMKRAHDSSSVPATATTIPATAAASDGGGHQRQKSPSPARPSVIPASPSSSNASVKPGRKMKPIGTKTRPSKMAKVSNSISEREVEVAEVLFGLTRQFQNHHHHSAAAAAESYANASKSDVKETSNDAAAAAPPEISKVLSPMMPAPSSSSPPISSPISPPSSSTALSLPQQSTSIPAPAMAPKRKRPRPAKPEEASPAITMRPPAPLGGVSATHTTINSVPGTRNDAELGSQLTKTEILSVKTEPIAAFSGKGISLVVSTTSASASTGGNFNPISSPPPLNNQSDVPIVSEKIVGTNMADSKPTTSEKIIEAKVADLKVTCENITGNKTAEMKLISEKIAGAKSADLKYAASEKTVGTNIAESMSTPTPSAEKKPSGVSEHMDKMVPEVSEAPVDHNATEEVDTATSYLPFSPDLKVEAVKTFHSPKIENTYEEKFKIDLMAPPGKSFLDTEDDSGPDAVGTASSEAPAPEKGTVEITNIPEGKAVAAKEEKETERWHLKLEETEKKHDKRDDGEEKATEKHNVKERNIDLQLEGEDLEKDSCNPIAQKQSRLSKNESRVEKLEKSATAATGNASTSSGVASMSIPMTVASWPGGLHALGRYFGPAPAGWPGAPSIPGVLPLEGTNTTPAIQPAYILQQSRQTWKRCATHSYIAHFIECQQRMVPHPFWHAPNYGNSVALYGGKPYNLNMPLPPPAEIINLGGPLPGTVSVSSTGNSGSTGNNSDSLQDRNIGSAAFGAFNSQSAKGKNTPYMDSRRKHPSHQQAAQQLTSTISQQGPPGFGFPTAQSGAGGANSNTACSTGNTISLGNAAGLGTAPGGGTGGGNSNSASICAEPYMAMIPQNGYPFGINTHAHFGATFNGTSNHIGQQQAAPPFFNSPFYATQLLPPPQHQPPSHLQPQPQPPTHVQPQPQPQPQPQSQQHGLQNPSTSSGSSSSQKHQQHLQGPCNFSSSQKQQHQGTPSPSPSNSQQQHHLPASQARQIEREANNGADSPSTADSRIPAIQKNFYSQGSPSNSNFNAQQELAFMAAFGAKHNGKQQQQQHPPLQVQHQIAPGYTIQQHHGNDPALQMSLKGLEHGSQSRSGILGFPPMAQGHHMLQGMSESARHQMAAQVQHAIQSGGQPQRSGQMQRPQSTSSGEGRNVTDSMSNAGGRGREEEQKSSIKGGLGHSMKFSRIEIENSANIHGGSLTDGGLSTSLVPNGIENMGRTLNMITSGGNGSRNSLPTSSSSHSNPQPPSSQQLSQNAKPTVGRAKPGPNQNVLPPVASAQTTLSSYGDRTGVSSNMKLQTSPPFPGQNLKQGQHSQQWKMTGRTSSMPIAAGSPTQASLATMKNFPQQGRNQPGNPNIGPSPVAPSQASFATSTKSSGQPPANQQNNSGSIMPPRLSSANSVTASVVGALPLSPQPPVSKSVSTPSLRTTTGSKGPISQQKSIAPVSNKKSSPVGSRSTPSVLGPSHISQNSSVKSNQQQYQQQPQQSVSSNIITKNQQYHNQAHFNPPQLLFTQNGQFLQQQAVQQSQFSPQSAHQVSGLQQKQQMQGSNSPQTSFSNPHLRQQQEQQQQMQPGSSTSSTSGTLGLASPTLTLGGGPTKINPSGSLGGSLHAQYSGQHQSDVLNQDQINGVQMLPNPANLCTSSVQNRNPFNASSSPQATSNRMPSGSLKKSGGNMAESMSSPGGLSLSMALSSGVRTHNSGLASSVNGMQHAKSTSVSSTAVHSGQMPSIPLHQPSVPPGAGPISTATSVPHGLHGQAATSVVQP